MQLSFFVDAEAKQFADSQRALYFETSAKSGKNVRAVFDTIGTSAWFVCFDGPSSEDAHLVSSTIMRILAEFSVFFLPLFADGSDEVPSLILCKEGCLSFLLFTAPLLVITVIISYCVVGLP